MNFTTILFIAIGLSMDAFAVSVTNGIMLKHVKPKDALKISGAFGIFQGLMPLIGWAVGISFEKYITSVDHWIALILLGFIGGKMIYETLQPEETEECSDEECRRKVLDNKTILLLAIATSIDALAVGVSFAFLKVNIAESIIVIGVTTFVLCFIGVFIGKKCGELLKRYAELFGGIILILIGLKIFIEHTNIIAVLFR